MDISLQRLRSWFAPKNHCLSMAVVVAYDVYQEIVNEAFATFGLSAIEANNARMTFHQFREKLSQQGLEYDPRNCNYHGDKLMRVNTKMSKSARDESKTPGSNNRPKKTSKLKTVTEEQLKEAKKGLKTRLCGDLTKIGVHLKSEERISNQVCVFCGQTTYTKCGVCDAALHNNPSTGKCKGFNCFIDYHSDVCFGLAKNDSHMLRKRKSDWIAPTAEQRRANKDLILSLQGAKKKPITVTPSDRVTRSVNKTT